MPFADLKNADPPILGGPRFSADNGVYTIKNMLDGSCGNIANVDSRRLERQCHEKVGFMSTILRMGPTEPERSSGFGRAYGREQREEDDDLESRSFQTGGTSPVFGRAGN